MQIQASDSIAQRVLEKDVVSKVKNNPKLARAFYAAMLAVDEKKSKCRLEDIMEKYSAIGDIPDRYKGKEAVYYLKSTIERGKKTKCE
ncbi:Uncharacterised protein [uncultured archaeon]|nr:Uncharacterised protein [uncultured archaeon]